MLSLVVICCSMLFDYFFASQINFSPFLILFLKRSVFLFLFILMPFQGDCRPHPIPRALPWAKCSLALQAVAKQRDAPMGRLYFVAQGWPLVAKPDLNPAECPMGRLYFVAQGRTRGSRTTPSIPWDIVQIAF